MARCLIATFRNSLLITMAFVVNSALIIAQAGELTVSTDFEGASADVVRIDQRHVVIQPAGDPQFGWPCWWYFRLDGIQPGETVTIEVSATDMKKQDGKPLGSDWALPRRAAYSIDGKNWQQTEPAEPTDGHATWTLPIDRAVVRARLHVILQIEIEQAEC